MKTIAETSKSHSQKVCICIECLSEESNGSNDYQDKFVCKVCATRFYTDCHGCGSLIANDEALQREDVTYCPKCFTTGSTANNRAILDEAEIAALVTEYIALHAEEKKVKDRLEEVKETLKSAASFQQRINDVVVLKSDFGAAVKCAYKQSLKCNTEGVAALETMFGEETFTSLFARKVSYNANKENIESFLREEVISADIRDAVKASIEQTETATLTVVRAKK